MDARTTLLDITDLLAEARHKAQVLANELRDGGPEEVRVEPVVQATVEAIKGAQAVKAVALGEVENWFEPSS